MNFKRLNRVSDAKKVSVLDAEIARVKVARSKISDSASDKFKVLDAQYKALIRKKLRDSRQVIEDADLSEVKSQMLDDLKNQLQSGKIYFATGAEIPGETVLYTSKETLVPALQRYGGQFDSHLADVKSEEDVKSAFAKLGVENSLIDPFYKIALNWEGDGEFKVYSSSNVEDLVPAITSFAQIFLDGGEAVGEVMFKDDNDDTGVREFETL